MNHFHCPDWLPFSPKRVVAESKLEITIRVFENDEGENGPKYAVGAECQVGEDRWIVVDQFVFLTLEKLLEKIVAEKPTLTFDSSINWAI